MPNAAYSESQLHKFGKMCFEDAEGKTIKLPPAASPMFDPPKIFNIKRVEFEKDIPYAGYVGRKPDILLTNEHGHKLVVEVKNSSSKNENYLQDMGVVGMSLVLELDVSKWKKQTSLMPDFSKGSPLQTVISQTKWLSCGQPREMEWRPYALVLYECDSEDICHSCQMLRRGFRSGRRGNSLRLFYSSPGAPLSVLARETGLGRDEVHRKVYQGLATFSIDCKRVSLVTPTLDGKYIDSIEDRNPDKTQREMGWVLLRDGRELPRYRIRRLSEGFQAVVYEHSFEMGQPDHDQIYDFQQKLANNPFPIQETWKAAVKNLFSRLAPFAIPLYEIKGDEWKPGLVPSVIK